MSEQKTPFENWWYYEGSAPPKVGEDIEEFTKRMCQNAWAIGAAMQEQSSPVVKDSLTTQAMKLALEALEALIFNKPYNGRFGEVIAALEEALAKKEQPIKEVVVNADYREMWKQQVEMNQQLTATLSAQPAKQEQGEPVAEYLGVTNSGHHLIKQMNTLKEGMLFYTTPQQRPSRSDIKPLTDEQIDKATRATADDLLDHIYEYGTAAEGVMERIRAISRAAIEAAHGIKE
jgi:hypothetical protein